MLRRSRRALAALVPVPLVVAGLLVGPGADLASARPGFQPDRPMFRLGGADRFETAALGAQDAFPDGADTAVLANGWRNVDALTGTYLAGLADAPVLLTERDSVPAATIVALRSLGVTDVVVLGDATSVGPEALQQLRAAGLTIDDVVAGEDRYDTAAQIAGFGDAPPRTVFLARGDFPVGSVAADALAAGPYAYDGHRAILLTPAGRLPDVVAELLDAAQPAYVYVLGGAITDDVLDEVAELAPYARIERVAGADRTETAAKLPRLMDDRAFTLDRTPLALANGYSVDALSAGVWAGRLRVPLLLTAGTDALGRGTEEFLAGGATGLVNGVVFGSPATFPQALAERARDLGQGGPADPVAVTAVDVAAGSLSLSGTPITTHPQDRFGLDGRRVTRAEFLAAAHVGDRVVSRGRGYEKGIQDLELLTTRPADWTTGFVDHVGGSDFRFVEPRTGLVLRTVRTVDVPASATFTIEGRAVTREAFLADVNTADEIRAASDGSTFSLVNRPASGEVLAVDDTGYTMRIRDSVPLRFSFPTDRDVLTLAGEPATAAEFSATITVGRSFYDETVGGVRRMYG